MAKFGNGVASPMFTTREVSCTLKPILKGSVSEKIRSIYKKVGEIKEFVEDNEIDIVTIKSILMILELAKRDLISLINLSIHIYGNLKKLFKVDTLPEFVEELKRSYDEVYNKVENIVDNIISLKPYFNFRN